MDPFAKDFDDFFTCMSGSSSGTLGTSAKGDRPPIVPSGKGKLPVSSFGGSQGTLATHKRKLDSLFTVPVDLMEGELDLVANKWISHLADCFLNSSECISTDKAMEADKLYLNERYSRALKACHDVSAPLSLFFFLCVSLILFIIIIFFFCRRPSTSATVSATLVASQPHRPR